jgi:hypothetical protein
MREHLVEIIFTCLSVIYLTLYARDYFARRQPARRAWLRMGVIFGVISGVLWYLHA